MHLGGGSLINGTQTTESQLLKLTRISTNLFAIIDSDRNSPAGPLPKNIKDFAALCKKVGIDCHVLNYAATENYWTDAAVLKAKGPGYRALKPYEKLKSVSPSWSKAENWLITREMTEAELEPTDLWQFLKKL